LWVLVITLTGCGFPAWRDQALENVGRGGSLGQGISVVGSGLPSQAVEFYDPAGRHIGYGKAQGGSVEFFNIDSSRAGFGRR